MTSHRHTRTFMIFMVMIPLSLAGNDQLLVTLRTSVDMALAQNPQIKIAEKEVAKARAAIGEAYSVILPRLDAYVNFQHNWEIQTSRIPNFIKPMLAPLAGTIPEIAQMPDFVDIAFGLENTVNYGLTVTQPLFLGWSGMAGIHSAKAAGRASEYNLEMQRQQLILRSAGAFYTCLLTAELLKVQEEALDQARANFEVVSKKFEVGSASGFDKMRAEVEVSNLEPPLIAARNNYQAALSELRMILGLERSTHIEISGELRYEDDEFLDRSLEELQNLALAERPEMLALGEQQRIALSGITIARSNYLPRIFFQTDYSFLGMRDDLKFRRGDFSKGFSSAITIQIPLFHGLQSLRQYQKARLEHQMTRDSEKQLSDQIIAEVEVAYNRFREARQAYLSARKSVDLAIEALRMANLMYEEGANTQLDVLSARLALTRARMNHATSLFEYQVARYQLRKATGQLTEAL